MNTVLFKFQKALQYAWSPLKKKKKKITVLVILFNSSVSDGWDHLAC